MNTQQIFDVAMMQGGLTINLTTNEIPTNGFAVSIPNKELQVSYKYFSPEVLQNFINTNVAALIKSNTFLGIWTNEGKVYLDLSIITNNLEEAILLGIEWNQKCVFDLANLQEIFLPAPQTNGTAAQRKTYANMKSRELAQMYK